MINFLTNRNNRNTSKNTFNLVSARKEKYSNKLINCKLKEDLNDEDLKTTFDEISTWGNEEKDSKTLSSSELTDNLQSVREQAQKAKNLESKLDINIITPSFAVLRSETAQVHRGKSEEQINKITNRRIELLKDGLIKAISFIKKLPQGPNKDLLLTHFRDGISLGAISNLGKLGYDEKTNTITDQDIFILSRQINTAVGDKFEKNAQENYGENMYEDGFIFLN